MALDRLSSNLQNLVNIWNDTKLTKVVPGNSKYYIKKHYFFSHNFL